MHGGKTPVGIAAARYKHGRTSKYLPKRMQSDFNYALRDQSLSLTKDVAVLEARLLDLYKRVDSGESGRLWTELRQTATTLTLAREANDWSQVAQLIIQIVATIEHGAADHELWEQIARTTLQKARITRVEHQRVTVEQTMIQIDRVLLMMSALADEMRTQVIENVEDLKARQRILVGVSTAIGKFVGPTLH
jgi:hypothetical protein